jgi:hypothetical protein
VPDAGEEAEPTRAKKPEAKKADFSEEAQGEFSDFRNRRHKIP